MKTMLLDFIESLFGLFKNPHVLIFAVAHWMLVGFFYFTGRTEDFIGWKVILALFIFIIDLPAILPAVLLWSPAFIFGNNQIFLSGTIFISIFTITLEWLIIGKIILNFFSSFELQMTTLSLKDE